jgi:hypothetical protein
MSTITLSTIHVDPVTVTKPPYFEAGAFTDLLE